MAKRTRVRHDRLAYTGEAGEQIPAQCNDCLHNRGNGTCRAFPEGIPRSICNNTLDHRNAIKGDGGYRWAPADGAIHPNDEK